MIKVVLQNLKVQIRFLYSFITSCRGFVHSLMLFPGNSVEFSFLRFAQHQRVIYKTQTHAINFTATNKKQF